MTIKKWFISSLVSLTFLFLIGCSLSNSASSDEEQKNYGSYKYGVIYTHNMKNQSEIKLFSENGKLIKNIPLDAGGLQAGYRHGNHIYFPVLGNPSREDQRILEFNLDTLQTRFIQTESLPVKMVVKEDFGYAIHNSNANYGILTKIDLQNDSIVQRIQLDGVLRNITADKNHIYVVADHILEKNQTIYRMNSELSDMMKVVNNHNSFPNDILIVNNKLYIMNLANKEMTGPTNLLTWLDLSSNEIHNTSLEEASPYQIFDLESQQIVIHFDPITFSGDAVTTLNTPNQVRVKHHLQNLPVRSHIHESELYSTDLNRLFVYDVEDFTLKGTYDLPEAGEMMITDFFVK